MTQDSEISTTPPDPKSPPSEPTLPPATAPSVEPPSSLAPSAPDSCGPRTPRSRPQPQPWTWPRLGRRTPWVTLTVVAVCLGVHLLPYFVGEAEAERLDDLLAQDRLAVSMGELWRPFTALVVHPMAFHLVLNMLAHFLTGRVLEWILGPWRFLLLFLGSGLSGALLFQVFSTGTSAVGASGAVFGEMVVYLYLLLGRRERHDLLPSWRFTRLCVFMVLSDQLFAYLLEASSGGRVIVGVSAHLGGLLGGLPLGYALVARPPGGPRLVVARRWMGLAIYLALVGGLGIRAACLPIDDSELLLRFQSRPVLEALREGRFEAAKTRWEELSAAGEDAWRLLGYTVFDECMGAEQDELAARILERLTQATSAVLESKLREAKRTGHGAPTADLLNELAWYLALKGERLQEALQYANTAVDAARREGPAGLFGRLLGDPQAAALSSFVNTRGWVLLRGGSIQEGLRDLEEAARLSAEPVNKLYLALGYDAVGRAADAVELIEGLRASRQQAQLTKHQRRLLRELEERLPSM